MKKTDFLWHPTEGDEALHGLSVEVNPLDYTQEMTASATYDNLVISPSWKEQGKQPIKKVNFRKPSYFWGKCDEEFKESLDKAFTVASKEADRKLKKSQQEVAMLTKL